MNNDIHALPCQLELLYKPIFYFDVTISYFFYNRNIVYNFIEMSRVK